MIHFDNFRKMFNFCLEFDMVAVVDNRSNPVMCARHSTKEFRREISRGQRKYTLDVQYRFTNRGRSVELVEDDRDNHEYKVLYRVQSKF